MVDLFQGFLRFIALGCALFLFGLCNFAVAQMSDPFSIRHAWVDDQGNRTLDLQGGAPPIIGSNWLWTHSFSFREQTLNFSFQNQDYKLRPQQLGYSTFFRKPWNENWSLNIGGSLAQRGLTDVWDIRSGSTHGAAFFFFNQNPGRRWRWTLGLVVLDRTARFPVLPGFSVDFETQDKVHSVRIAFPQISYAYSPTKVEQYGVMFRYEGTSFLIQDKSAFPAFNGDYLQQERIVLSPFHRKELVPHIWGDVRLGYTLWSQTRVLGEGYRETQKLASYQGVYLSLGVSYRF